jgi:hypothetical protein
MEKTLVQEEQQVAIVSGEMVELCELQLALIGGGIGETVL